MNMIKFYSQTLWWECLFVSSTYEMGIQMLDTPYQMGGGGKRGISWGGSGEMSPILQVSYYIHFSHGW